MERAERDGIYGSGGISRPRRMNEGRTPLRGGLRDFPRSERRMPRQSNGKAMKASAVVVFAAVAIIVASVALVPANAPSIKNPVHTEAPLPVFLLVGYTYDQNGTKMGGAAIHVHDVTSNAWNNTTLSNPSTAFYSVDINNGLTGGVAGGHVINITATFSTLLGHNQSALPAVLTSFFEMNCTLRSTVVIPEFSSLLLPLVGMFGLLAAVSVVAGRRKK
jgi:hypothetical protein